MFYRKEIIFPNVKQKAVSLAEDMQKFGKDNFSEKVVNFKLENGALTDGFGIEAMKLGTRVFSLDKGVRPLKIYFYPAFDRETGERSNTMMVYADDGQMYSTPIRENSTFIQTRHPFTQPPKYLAAEIDSVDVLLFYGKDGLYSYDGQYKKISDLEFTSIALSKGRFFGAVKTGEVWYSEFSKPVFDASCLDSGFIIADKSEPGGNVAALKDCVYLFRYGKIYRVKHDSRSESIEFSKLAFAADRIYGETVIKSGLKLLFLTNGGFYLFDGSAFKETAEGAKKYFKGKDIVLKAKGVYAGEVYYSFEVDGERLVLCINPENGNFYTFEGKFPIDDFCFYTTGTQQNLAVASTNEIICELCATAKILSQPLTKIWKTHTSDFGVRGRIKLLKEIYIRSETDAKLTIRSEYGCRKLEIKGKKEQNILAVKLKGNAFSLEICSQKQGALIEDPVLIFYVKEE